MVNLPEADGWITGCGTNQDAGPPVLKLKLLAHSCTAIPARRCPPEMVKVTFWVALAVVASMIVLQAVPPLRTSVT